MKRASADVSVPTVEELNEEHMRFLEIEPRDLFYRAATELVELALCAKIKLTTAEAVAVLLQTWNASYYRFRKGLLGGDHLLQVEHLLDTHDGSLRRLRDRSIETLGDADEPAVRGIFKDFENVLGPVGAAKALHLLAPEFFPLWDRAIAAAKPYRLPLRKMGENHENYWKFMLVVQQQYQRIEWQRVTQQPLKALDEFNYCRYTRKPRT